MAILGKIRSKGVLLLVIIGFALLAFIVGDALTQGSTFFNKSRETVAEIEGEGINIKDYSAAIDQLTEVYKIEYGVTELNEDMIGQIRSSVWEVMITEKLVASEAEKLGLAIGEEELADNLIGNNIHPLIMQRRAFADKNGQFSRDILLRFLNSLEQAPENEEMRKQIETAKNYWMYWEKTIKNALLHEKYNALISKSVTTNSLDAKTIFEASKISSDVNYVLQPYFAISDSLVAVSKSEIKARYNKQIEQYKQEANRSINYVVFNVTPSAEDYQKAETTMNILSEEFKTTEDIATFVNENSETRYDGIPYSENTVPVNFKSFAFGNETGAVIGPIFFNDTYTMARIVETDIMQPDSVKLSHIFLPPADSSKVDSLIAVVKAGGNFAELAQKYSAVEQTASKGGDIGWITEYVQDIDKEIIEKAFANNVNGVFTIETNQGTQIMQVTDKTPIRKKVRLGFFEIKVVPSSNTISKIYNDAKQFAAELSADKFESKAKENNYPVRTAIDLLQSSDKIANIAQSRQIVRWAYESNEGDVSDVFDCNDKFIVATTTEINEKGYRPLEKVSDQINAEIIRDKKAEIMIKNLSAQLQKNPTLEALAATIGGSVSSATGVNFSSNQFGNSGAEASVIGKVSALPVNKISEPIKGNAGVYVILPLSQIANEAPFSPQRMIMLLNSRMSNSLPYMILQNIRDNADITDNRLNFF